MNRRASKHPQKTHIKIRIIDVQVFCYHLNIFMFPEAASYSPSLLTIICRVLRSFEKDYSHLKREDYSHLKRERAAPAASSRIQICGFPVRVHHCCST